MSSGSESLPSRTKDGKIVPVTPETPSLSDLAESKDRRVKILDSEFTTPQDVTAYPLRTPSQNTVMLNLTHKKQRPSSEQPGFRIIGVTASREEAVAFTEEHYKDSKETVFLSPLHQLVPICKSDEVQLDHEYAISAVNSIIKLHEKMVDDRNADFKKTVADQKTGGVGAGLGVTREKARRKREASSKVQIVSEQYKTRTANFAPVSGVLSASKMISKQSFAVVIVMQDIRQRSLHGDIELEPLVAVLFVAENREEATKYAKYTAAKVYKDCVIDVIDMYAWMFPESVNEDDIATEEYGNEELSAIMKARKTNKQKITEFENWYEQNKRDGDKELLLEPSEEQSSAGTEVLAIK